MSLGRKVRDLVVARWCNDNDHITNLVSKVAASGYVNLSANVGNAEPSTRHSWSKPGPDAR